MPEALKKFHQSNILLVKEGGDTSHIIQSYGQQVTKSDKLDMRHLIDMVCTYVKSIICQYIPFVTFCMELNKVCSTDAW